MIDLCELEDVKLRLEMESQDFDTDLAVRITDVSHRIQNALDIDLESQTYVEYHCGGGKWIYVRNPPITSVTSIVFSSTFDFANGETIDTVDYLVTNNGWDISHVVFWPGGSDNLQVTYISGFVDAASVDPPLKQAAAKQVAFEFQHRKTEGLQSVELADGNISKDENNQFLKSVMQTMRKYKKAKLG
jgi:hypothetical protein